MKTYKRILAIDPANKGFGFAVMEGKNSLIDWGVKEVKDNSSERCLIKTKGLIEQYLPESIIVEDYAGKDSRRCPRVQELIREIRKVASENKIKVFSFSRAAIKEAFSSCNALTKHEIAKAIAEELPELELRLPSFRKPWMSEDYRMSIFDAVALALTFYYFYEHKKELNKQQKENISH